MTRTKSQKARAKAANGQPKPQMNAPKSKKEKGAGSNKKQKQASVAAAYATGQVGKAPVITMSKDSCRIVHRELIASVTGSVAYTVAQQFALQPGLAASFPWLSVTAQAWEQYRFNKLKYCYYTRTGSNVPGSVMMAPDYDAADAAPASEQVASAFEDVAEDAPWKDIECQLNPKSMDAGRDRHFTRTGALAANLDVKEYDCGNLNLITLDGTAVSWGKLWVEYDVTFFVPQLPPNGGAQVLGGRILGATTQTAANPLGVAPTVDSSANGISVNTASVVTLAQTGTYLVQVTMAGTVLTAQALAATSGCVVTTVQPFLVNAAGTASQTVFSVVTSSANATVSLTATATTVTGCAVYIATVPDGSLA
jgi:hypothetical protein